MFFKIILLAFNLWSYQCPQSVYEKPKVKKIHEYLGKIDQNLFFRNCEVEMVLCEKSEDENGVSPNPVAEFYILDDKGREAYLPILFDSFDQNQRVKMILNKTTFYYERRDRNYEDVLGRTEYYRFEMRKHWGSEESVEVVELGLYSTNTQLNQTNGNDSHWFVCE